VAGACGSGDGGDDIPVGAYCDPAASWDPTYADLEEQVLALVNQRRAEGADCGGAGTFAAAGALTMNGALRCAARVHSKDMADRGFFSHKNPDGDDPFDRMAKAGYTFSYAGENIAQGYPTPEAVMAGWMSSDGHCSNIMSPNYTEIGVGYYDGAYWTQTFGRP
jgi:uncharacterized protein YkwD